MPKCQEPDVNLLLPAVSASLLVWETSSASANISTLFCCYVVNYAVRVIITLLVHSSI